MKQIRQIMGMPVIIEIIGPADAKTFNDLFKYFHRVDHIFSTYKKNSEISRINRGEIKPNKISADMKEILRLARQTKKITNGYFDIQRNGRLDPSGIVKGWAIHQAAEKLRQAGLTNFYVEAGGDIEVSGANKNGRPWTIGIRNPFNIKEIIKAVRLNRGGIATSGSYERGAHIYNPKDNLLAAAIASLTVIGPNTYEADRLATAAFAMGEKGINFIEQYPGLEGYAIDLKGTATMTSDFDRYL